MLRKSSPSRFEFIHEGEVKGYLDIESYDPCWGSKLAQNEVYIHSVNIFHQHQNKGLGTQMIREALEKIKDMGKSSAKLHVYPDNLRARRVYSKCGFKEIEGRATQMRRMIA